MEDKVAYTAMCKQSTLILPVGYKIQIRKKSSTNQYEEEKKLSNHSMQHRCACGAIRIKGHNKFAKEASRLRNTLRRRGDDSGGLFLIFAPMNHWLGGHNEVKIRSRDC